MARVREPLEPAVAEALAELQTRPSFQTLIAAVEDAHDKSVAKFARRLMRLKDPVDQRELDRFRGYWQGALWAVRDFPAEADKDWTKWINEAMKESDEQ